MAVSSFDLDAWVEQFWKVVNEEKATEQMVLLEDCWKTQGGSNDPFPCKDFRPESLWGVLSCLSLQQGDTWIMTLASTAPNWVIIIALAGRMKLYLYSPCIIKFRFAYLENSYPTLVLFLPSEEGFQNWTLLFNGWSLKMTHGFCSFLIMNS